MSSNSPQHGNPRIRVVILEYNRATLTLQCINSVLQQKYSPIDILIVDNDSENTEKMLLKSQLPSGVQLIENKENVGYATANNIGAKSLLFPKPGYILFINNDVTLVDQNCVEKLVSRLEGNPSWVSCSPLVLNVPSKISLERQIQLRRIPDLRTTIISSSWWLRRIPRFRHVYDLYIYSDLMPYSMNLQQEVETINGSCFLIKQEFLEAIGYFDEGTFLYFEEIILGFQIKRFGKAACLDTSCYIEHLQGSSTSHNANSFSYRMAKIAVKSEILYLQKYLHVSRLAISLLVFVRFFDILTKAVFAWIQR